VFQLRKESRLSRTCELLRTEKTITDVDTVNTMPMARVERNGNNG